MKKFLFSILLILSIGANLTAGAFLLIRQGPGFKKSPSPGANLATGSLSVSSAAMASHLGDLRLTKEMLLAEGYSPKVVRMILTILVGQKPNHFAANQELKEAFKRDGITPELRQKSAELAAQVFEEVRGLIDLGPEVDAEEQLRQTYAVRYGDIPVATAETLRRLENAHREMTDRKFAVVLKDVLTPEQIEEYMRYNSLLARMIQSTLSSIDIDEATYTALLNAAIEREKSSAPDATRMELARRNLHPSSVETYRRVLGDEQFLAVISRFDSVSASADAVYQVAGLPPSARADLFMEAYDVRYRWWTGTLGTERIPEIARRTYRSLIQKAQLTPEQTEGFDRMLGAYLKRGELGAWGMSSGHRGW